MDTKVYSKNDILQKLAQDGFFVDYLTLDSFFKKYKIEAIFEDENGSEFFDKSAYDILVTNVLKRPLSPPKEELFDESNVNQPTNEPVEGISGEIPTQEDVQNTMQEDLSVQEHQEAADTTDFNIETSVNDIPQEKKVSLENIKWYRWDDVSADLTTDEGAKEDVEIIDSDKKEDVVEPVNVAKVETIEPLQFETSSTPEPEQAVQTQESYWSAQPAEQNEDVLSPQNNVSPMAQEEKENYQNENDNLVEQAPSAQPEEDFDDINLLSDSIEAQEKFQKYIVSELAKKNIDLSLQKPENAFKFDISEKTLNMIARAIAKKIAKQVSNVLSNNDGNNIKLIEAEKKSEILEQRVATLEEQNKKLKLLLVESNKNLNSYKPTFFGLYRFVRRKTKKR